MRTSSWSVERNSNLTSILRKLCEQLYREEEDLRQLDNQVRPGAVPEPPPFNDMYADPDSNTNDDLRLATLSRLRAIAKRRENLMPNEEFCQLMRATNLEQRSILLETIHHLTSQPLQPLLVFPTGPAGCGKTFVIRLIMEIYNKYGTTNAHCNAYLTCALTGKAAVAISGTIIHTARSLSTSLDNSLSSEALQQFGSLFQHIRLMLIDEVSMVGAELFE
nr:uncharacterized protein LOC107438268 [Parasteatoda tepidariorum]